MALKPDRKILPAGEEIIYFLNEVAERGIIVTHDTSGSGASLDDDAATVQVPTGTGDGVPAGLLLNDVVNIDPTRQHLNPMKDEVLIGSKVTLLTHGWVVTNKIRSGQTPTAGSDAYQYTSGELTVTGGYYKVGKFLSAADEDGYAMVEINLPN